MKINIIEITGKTTALLGLGLSYGITSDLDILDFNHYTNDSIYAKCLNIANNLAHKQGGHNKFLESINISLDIKAPRYWWSEFDTYRVGITKQSESTIHTLTKRKLTAADFNGGISQTILDNLNTCINKYNNAESKAEQEHIFHNIKVNLPEGYLQRRIVVCNAKTLQNIIAQRHNHRLHEWYTFCTTIYNSFVEFPDNPLRTWIFPEGYTPPQEDDPTCPEHSS